MKKCAVSDCNHPSRCRGWCDKHYRRWQKHGSALTVLPRGNKWGQSKVTVPKAEKTPSVKDLHWAAGFMEGEGSFSCHNVSAGQKQREPLTRLKKWFGGSIKRREQRGDAFYSWCVSGARARGVAMTLYPILSPRRQKQVRDFLSAVYRRRET